MNFRILSVGKQTTEYAYLTKKYIKMTGWKIEEIEIPHSRKSSREEIIQAESKLILSKFSKNSYNIALDVRGKHLASEQFADLFLKQMMLGQGIDFIIGGAFGIDNTLKKSCNFMLSLSEMTLPHQMAKLVLVEQIYRAESIIKNHPYHK